MVRLVHERELKISNVFSQVHGVEYISQRAASLYVASGTASDW